jgi:hypothetical protein
MSRVRARAEPAGERLVARIDAHHLATRIELISLLKFDDARVYVSESLQRMQDLIEAPTRPRED